MMLPRLARDHAARDRLGDVEHAVEIGVHEFAPGLLGIVFERRRGAGFRRC